MRSCWVRASAPGTGSANVPSCQGWSRGCICVRRFPHMVETPKTHIHFGVWMVLGCCIQLSVCSALMSGGCIHMSRIKCAILAAPGWVNIIIARQVNHLRTAVCPEQSGVFQLVNVHGKGLQIVWAKASKRNCARPHINAKSLCLLPS